MNCYNPIQVAKYSLIVPGFMFSAVALCPNLKLVGDPGIPGKHPVRHYENAA